MNDGGESCERLTLRQLNFWDIVRHPLQKMYNKEENYGFKKYLDCVP